ncbi:flagellar basal body rod protein FlgF [Paraglaciecola arctica]|uniref:Flagellar basal-body rod protein FlgF n=1 Tax=Paraglaciecola arctica BSs20135 TaxID=493475 RepID=K6YAB0_9ALTE|nr:flagellar basal body rod protein FlgF [Paraglaciecola arctica]GAC20856.1 flagellar basal-body rod protein FlgF [Paraglaciecola arctica BSs20135]|tara:strand:- start:6994 stop:7737 length:744 start_codon:yes stop_codon:yes gene_type:complete
MDKLLYIAASGAKQDLLGAGVRANNLANAQTTGFKSQLEQARAMPAFGEGLPTRVFSMTENVTNNYEGGAMIQTGRELDLAIQGDGWFSVLDAQGNEAYSRNGSFELGPDGALKDTHGNTIIGDFGPIYLPVPLSNVNIANDGTLSVQPQGAPETVLEEVGRLKFVNPNVRDMERGTDGLFRLKSGELAQEDPQVSIRTGMLEGSNVNPVEEMVNMINLQRHYEMQVKMMKQAEDLDTRGNQLLRII